MEAAPSNPIRQTSNEAYETVGTDDNDLHTHEKPHHRTYPLSIFQILVIIGIVFICLALGLGLGLGLGFGLKNSSPSPQLRGNTSSGNFNYSSFYGIPQNLPIIPFGNLTNVAELNLEGLGTNGVDTPFSLSDPPTTRLFSFNITQALASPDGYQKPMIVINGTLMVLKSVDEGQFPGPLIQANVGDTIVVNVINSMTNWSTAVHWHGIYQTNTNWMDGVAGFLKSYIFQLILE
jgi:FtsP/CotA-like multicopper oxidase with cupredoxin domain